MSRTPTPKARELDGVSSQTQREARALLKSTDSPELAKQAVPSSARQSDAVTARQDAFGKRNGFASYLEMFEASKPLGESDDKDFLITNVGPEQWIVWNDENLEVVRTFKSLEEAKQQMRATVHMTQGDDDAPPVG
jgi:hypothetical protein